MDEGDAMAAAIAASMGGEDAAAASPDQAPEPEPEPEQAAAAAGGQPSFAVLGFLWPSHRGRSSYRRARAGLYPIVTLQYRSTTLYQVSYQIQ
jgi:hypothetical protein